MSKFGNDGSAHLNNQGESNHEIQLFWRLVGPFNKSRILQIIIKKQRCDVRVCKIHRLENPKNELNKKCYMEIVSRDLVVRCQKAKKLKKR